MCADVLKSHILWGFENSFDEGKGIEANSLLEELKDLTAEQAAWSPPDGGYSIWVLVKHIADWKEQISRVLEGQDVEFDGNFPEPEVIEQGAWDVELENLKSLQAQLTQGLTSKSDEDLGQSFYKQSNWTWARVFTGIITHDAYHTGQILRLKQMQGIEV